MRSSKRSEILPTQPTAVTVFTDRVRVTRSGRCILTPGVHKIGLFFGADERRCVRRELTAREGDKTLVGDRRRIRYTYTLEVANWHAETQMVTVCDQLPVTRDEQIKVRLDTAEPWPDKHIDLNVLAWQSRLESGSQRRVRYSLTVEMPRTMRVEGLP